jgi:hypothetical protein
MGQQQLLLIILGVIIVGIAIAVGLSLFSAQSVASNKDSIVNDIANLAATSYQYRIRPASMGGGGGSYAGYTITSKLSSNDNATYTCTVQAPDGVTFVGTSVNGTVTGVQNATGNLTKAGWAYTGSFQ